MIDRKLIEKIFNPNIYKISICDDYYRLDFYKKKLIIIVDNISYKELNSESKKRKNCFFAKLKDNDLNDNKHHNKTIYILDTLLLIKLRHKYLNTLLND